MSRATEKRLESLIFGLDDEIARLTKVRAAALKYHARLTSPPTRDHLLAPWENLHSKLAAKMERQFYDASAYRGTWRQPAQQKQNREFVIAEECWRRMSQI